MNCRDCDKEITRELYEDKNGRCLSCCNSANDMAEAHFKEEQEESDV